MPRITRVYVDLTPLELLSLLEALSCRLLSGKNSRSGVSILMLLLPTGISLKWRVENVG